MEFIEPDINLEKKVRIIRLENYRIQNYFDTKYPEHRKSCLTSTT